METQFAQVDGNNAQRQQGQLPRQQIPKETDNVVTLKSGTQYHSPPMPTDYSPPPDKGDVVTEKEGEIGQKLKLSKGKEIKRRSKGRRLSILLHHNYLFPHRKQKYKVDQQHGKFMYMVQNPGVTVSFTDLISQVSVYAKFLKDMINKEKDFGGIVVVTEECSVVLQNKIPSKPKDNGSFSIPCTSCRCIVYR